MHKVMRYAAVAVPAVLVATPVLAQTGIDVTSATTILSGDVSAAIKSVGLAMIGLAALAVGFKWAKAAFFG